jgi:hypothetical protein
MYSHQCLDNPVRMAAIQTVTRDPGGFESGSRILRWPIDVPLSAIPVEQDVDARLGAELDRVALQAGRLLFPCAILRILLRDHFHGRLAFDQDDPDRLTEKIGIVKQVSP